MVKIDYAAIFEDLVIAEEVSGLDKIPTHLLAVVTIEPVAVILATHVKQSNKNLSKLIIINQILMSLVLI